MTFKDVLDLLCPKIDEDVNKFVSTLSKHKNLSSTIWLCGNGGSASIVSHFSADLENLGFFTKCLTDNQARVTALTNDVGFDNIYIEQMNHFKKGDVLIVASVHGGSGKDKAGKWSQNLVKACELAKTKKGTVLSLLGSDGGVIKGLSSQAIIIPDNSPYVVEGLHSVIVHLVCAKLKEGK